MRKSESTSTVLVSRTPATRLLGGMPLFRRSFFPLGLLLFLNPVPHKFTTLVDLPLHPVADFEQLAKEIASRHRVTLTHAKIAGYTEVDLPFPEAMAADELIGHRQRFYLDPLNDVTDYLGSQKGGGNLDYNEIGEGATVLLPVYHPGGLLRARHVWRRGRAPWN